MAPLNQKLPSSPKAGVEGPLALSSVALALMAVLLLIRRYRNRSSRLSALRSKNDIDKARSTPLTCRRTESESFSARLDANISPPFQEISRDAVQHGCGEVQIPMGAPRARDGQMEIPSEGRQGPSPPHGIQSPIPPNVSTDVRFHHDMGKVGIPYPVPTEVVIQLSSSQVKHHVQELDDEEGKGKRPFRTAGLHSETVQVFCDTGLDQPRKWRRRILEYS